VDTPPPPLPEYLVVANIPILSNVPDPWRAYLVDNPGFDDPIAGITDVAEVAMKTTSAYMYVLDGGAVDRLRSLICNCTALIQHYGLLHPTKRIKEGASTRRLCIFVL